MKPLLQRGDLFLSRYRIYNQLGEGGFGQVYYAYDQEKHREVAVKISRRWNLMPEGRFLARLSHPSIPRVYHCGMAPEGSYLVMQYIKGRTLQTVLEVTEAEEEPMPVEQVYDIVEQLAELLSYLHHYNPPIVFRDLKPSNIMLTKTDKIYLVDFGIACHDPSIVSLPPELALVGTLDYLPPETFLHGSISPAMDLYALGKIAYQLLVGSSSPSHDYPLYGPLGSLIMQLLHRDAKMRPSIKNFLQKLQRSQKKRNNLLLKLLRFWYRSHVF